MNIVVIRFKNEYEFSFNCENATISIDKMSGKLCGYSFKGCNDKKVLYINLNDVEIIYLIPKKESE